MIEPDPPTSSAGQITSPADTHEGGAPMTAALDERPLTAVDRCDRCGAQAYVRATLPSGGELLFCAHHFREHTDRLRELTAAIYDDTGRLADAPKAAVDVAQSK
jgi:hypothetical protein